MACRRIGAHPELDDDKNGCLKKTGGRLRLGHIIDARRRHGGRRH
jgi:hypothetical protein